AEVERITMSGQITAACRLHSRRAVTSLFAACLASLLLTPRSAEAQDGSFAIVIDGKPAATIVIAAEPIPSNQFAADELQSHVRQISGAVLPIATDADEVAGPRILIGQSRLTDALELEVPSGFSRELKEEGFLIKTVGRDLVLIGNDGGPVG